MFTRLTHRFTPQRSVVWLQSPVVHRPATSHSSRPLFGRRRSQSLPLRTFSSTATLMFAPSPVEFRSAQRSRHRRTQSMSLHRLQAAVVFHLALAVLTPT